jgi:hypothetical protein
MKLIENWSHAKRDARKLGLRGDEARRYALIKCIDEMDQRTVNSLMHMLAEASWDDWKSGLERGIGGFGRAWKQRSADIGVNTAKGIATGAAMGLGGAYAGHLVQKYADRNNPNTRMRNAERHLAKARMSKHAIPRAYHQARANKEIGTLGREHQAHQDISRHLLGKHPDQAIESVVDELLSSDSKKKWKSFCKDAGAVAVNTALTSGANAVIGAGVGAALHAVHIGRKAFPTYKKAMIRGAGLGAVQGAISGYKQSMDQLRARKNTNEESEEPIRGMESPMPYRDRTGYEAGYGSEDPTVGEDDYKTAELLTAAPMGIIRQAYGDDQVCQLCGTVNHSEDYKCGGCHTDLNPLAQYAPATND